MKYSGSPIANMTNPTSMEDTNNQIDEVFPEAVSQFHATLLTRPSPHLPSATESATTMLANRPQTTARERSQRHMMVFWSWLR